MAYSNYFRAVLFGFLGSCIIFVLTTLYIIGAPTPTAHTLHAYYELKHSYANSLRSPKILIVAGSNATFGISSRMITEETGISAANLGTSAGWGANYILHQAQPLAKPGDTIVLPLEYEIYTVKASQSDALLDYILAYDPKYLLAHPWFIASVSRTRLIDGISAKFRTLPRVEINHMNKPYSGDAIENQEAMLTAKQRRITSTFPPLSIKGKLNDDALGSIREFAQWCRSQNIKLLATWPNTIGFEIYQERSYQEFFQSIEQFYKSIGVTMLGKYSDSMYDTSMFYDSVYHLTDRGVRIRTRQLIELLKPYLNREDAF